MPKEIKKWSDDKLGFDEVTNANLVCKDCQFRLADAPTGKCMLFSPKPNEVLLGGMCDEYEKRQ